MNKQPLVGVFLALLSTILASIACMNGYGIHVLEAIVVDSGPTEFSFENGGTYLWSVENLKSGQYYEIIVKEKQHISSSGNIYIDIYVSPEDLKKCINCTTSKTGLVGENGLMLTFISSKSGGYQVTGTFRWSDTTIRTSTYIIEMRTVTK